MWIQNKLRTPEQGDRFPAGLICHFGVPDLDGPSAVECEDFQQASEIN
jgi:hypothetical protein